ncbi:MAG: hypothetical protein EKK46_08585 [Rhodocyclaceae bacterium]|nr:MAG: hypothetical protein EKK46_08585 [Rhodocyclaceae bacterium]
MKFNDEQLRVAANLRQYYLAWLETKRGLSDCDYSLSWTTRDGIDYLRYRSAIKDTTLGPRSANTERQLADHVARKAELVAQEQSRGDRLFETGRLFVALRMGVIASPAAAILREADIRAYLGTALMVVGTNALAAYELEAGARFAVGMDATEDFDLAWSGNQKTVLALAGKHPVSLLALLKSIDNTYTVNAERTFQARNKHAYEVELLIAPSKTDSLPKSIGLSPIPLPEQEWLLQGTPVDQVVCGRDGSPAHIVAPDPRWFALHKLWMAEKPGRDVLKKPKDARQGKALLDAISAWMPHYPLDTTFRDGLPDELRPHFDAWHTTQPARKDTRRPF